MTFTTPIVCLYWHALKLRFEIWICMEGCEPCRARHQCAENESDVYQHHLESTSNDRGRHGRRNAVTRKQLHIPRKWDKKRLRTVLAKSRVPLLIFDLYGGYQSTANEPNSIFITVSLTLFCCTDRSDGNLLKRISTRLKYFTMDPYARSVWFSGPDNPNFELHAKKISEPIPKKFPNNN